jgi:hypothetical protein
LDNIHPHHAVNSLPLLVMVQHAALLTLSVGLAAAIILSTPATIRLLPPPATIKLLPPPAIIKLLSPPATVKLLSPPTTILMDPHLLTMALASLPQ